MDMDCVTAKQANISLGKHEDRGDGLFKLFGRAVNFRVQVQPKKARVGDAYVHDHPANDWAEDGK